ncbi:MAG: hypothetical protein FJZ93_09975 [Chloroflexi bacterium]|nr:hypothetical protein [Chloroflexota bacterium]
MAAEGKFCAIDVNVAPAQAEQLSFEAVEYRNEEYGFSYKHPNNWVEIPWADPTIPKRLNVFNTMGASIYGPAGWAGVLKGGTNLGDVLAAFLQSVSFRNTNVTSSTEITLADGTSATLLKLKTTLPWIGDYQGIAVGVKKGMNWIYVFVGAVPKLVRYDESLCLEIAQTLSFAPASQPKPSEPIQEKITEPKAQSGDYELLPIPAGIVSFEAIEYRNYKYDFSFKYPKNWVEIGWRDPTTAKQVGILYNAGVDRYGPGVTVAILPGVTFKQAFWGVASALGYAVNSVDPYDKLNTYVFSQRLGAPVETLMIRLTGQDGTKYQGIAVAAKKGMNWHCLVMYTQPLKFTDVEYLFKEIAYTLEIGHKKEVQPAAEPSKPTEDKLTEPKTEDSDYDFEYLLSEQVVDASSLKKSHITWTLVVKNNTEPALAQVGLCIRSPVASLTVAKVYDEQGDIYFEYVDGRSPITLGESDAESVRIQFRSPVAKGETYKFTMELDAVTDIAQDYAYAFCDTENIFRRARLEIIAPRHYEITLTQPAQTGVNVVGERQIAAIEAENVNRLMLVAHFASTGNVSSRAFEDLSESISSASVVVSKPTLSWAVLACAVVAAVAVISWFLFLVPRRKRRLAQLSRISEEYEKKLAQWEKEGYDVKKIREKLKGSGED